MDTKSVTADYRMAKWAQVISDRKASGVTIKTYCQNTGISKDSYYYWQKKLREAACAQFALMPVESRATDLFRSAFTEVKLQDPLSQTLPIESGMHSNLQIQVSAMRINAGGDYPVDKLAYLLRELVKQC